MTTRDQQIALRDAVAAGKLHFHDFWTLAAAALPQDVRALNVQEWGAYDGSLDAALALHEALLPGWHYTIEDCRPDDVLTVQLGLLPSLDTGIYGEMPASRLFLLAILDAMIGETDE